MVGRGLTKGRDWGDIKISEEVVFVAGKIASRSCLPEAVFSLLCPVFRSLYLTVLLTNPL
jgi:hypothetical protein